MAYRRRLLAADLADSSISSMYLVKYGVGAPRKPDHLLGGGGPNAVPTPPPPPPPTPPPEPGGTTPWGASPRNSASVAPHALAKPKACCLDRAVPAATLSIFVASSSTASPPLTPTTMSPSGMSGMVTPRLWVSSR